MHTKSKSKNRHLACKRDCEFCAVGIICVDHCHRFFPKRIRSQIQEPFRFRLEISIESAVIIEMILREVGERRGVETQPIDAVLLQAMTGRFHRHMGDALVGGSQDDRLLVADPQTSGGLLVACPPDHAASIHDGVVIGEESMYARPWGLWEDGWRCFCVEAGLDAEMVSGDRAKLNPAETRAFLDWEQERAIDGFNRMYDFIKLDQGAD
jgi:hypothetical protein